MNIVWTQARKDLRYLAPVLIAWLVAELGLVVLPAAGLDLRLADVDSLSFLSLQYRTAAYVTTLLFALFAVMLVQSDNLVETRAFWLTRPIGGLRLMASKLIVASAILVLVPVVLDGAALLANGLGLRATMSALGLRLLVQAAWLLPLVAVAAVTPSLGRFALGVLLAVLAMAVLVANLNLLRVIGVRHAVDLPARLVPALVLLLAGSLAVIVHQYLTRRTARSTVGASVSLAGFVLVFYLWPWPSSPAERPAVLPQALDPDAVSVSVLPGSLQFARPSRAGEVVATLALDIRGLPPGVGLGIARGRSSFQTGDGRVEPLAFDRRRTGTYYVHNREASLRRALGPLKVIDPRARRDERPVEVVIGSLDEAAFARLEGRTGSLVAEIEFEVFEPRVVAESALEPGARYGTRSLQGRVVSAQLVTEALAHVEYEHVAPTPGGSSPGLEHPAARALVVLREMAARAPADLEHVLVNRARGEVVVPDTAFGAPAYPVFEPPLPTGSMLSITWVQVRATGVGYYDRTTLDSGWLEGARLALVERVFAGTFRKTVELPYVSLPAGR